jgi:hypothetical protein
VYEDNVADVSEVRATLIFRVEVCRAVEFLCIYRFTIQETTGGRVGCGDLPGSTGTVDREICPRKAPAFMKRPSATGAPRRPFIEVRL